MTGSSQRSVLRGFSFDRTELSGAVADVGVLVPIAVALIVQNGLSATAVLLPPALLYIVAAFRYRLPVPVQPLKAFGAIAIALGLGVEEIAAGALLLGGLFLLLGLTGWLDRVGRWVPKAVIRGVQLTVGLLFCKIAWGLVSDPPSAFRQSDWPPSLLIGGALVVAVLAWALRRRPVALVLVALAVVVMLATGWSDLQLGPSSIAFPGLSWAAFVAAAGSLVLPQAPLTFANSCLAPADAARTYFGAERARRVTPGRLAVSLGSVDVLAGAIGGMPVCHGAGGMTAHRSFGARTGGAPLVMGGALLVLAVVFGAGLAALLTGFPLPILAGLLAVAGVLHITLLKDLRRPVDWVIALAIGLAGFAGYLALGVGLGILVGLAVSTRDRRAAALRR